MANIVKKSTHIILIISILSSILLLDLSSAQASQLDQMNAPNGVSSTAKIIEITSGYLHSIALKSDGTVIAWGENTNGGATVPGGLNDVTAIAAGFGFSLALKSDQNDRLMGEARIWLSNSNATGIGRYCRHF